MNKSLRFSHLLIEAFVLVTIATLTPVIVLTDIVVLKNGVSESSITEYTQETLLFLCFLLMSYRAIKIPESRPALILAAGFFASLFIREFNNFLDETPINWVWPVSLIIASSLYIAWKEKEKTLASLLQFGNSRAFVFFIIGFISLIVFSRLFGSGGFMWKTIMADSYTSEFKTAIQEGLELYAYGIMAFGIFYSKPRDWLSQRHASEL